MLVLVPGSSCTVPSSGTGLCGKSLGSQQPSTVQSSFGLAMPTVAGEFTPGLVADEKTRDCTGLVHLPQSTPCAASQTERARRSPQTRPHALPSLSPARRFRHHWLNRLPLQADGRTMLTCAFLHTRIGVSTRVQSENSRRLNVWRLRDRSHLGVSREECEAPYQDPASGWKNREECNEDQRHIAQVR